MSSRITAKACPAIAHIPIKQGLGRAGIIRYSLRISFLPINPATARAKRYALGISEDYYRVFLPRQMNPRDLLRVFNP